jgi:hypothetical protein
MSGPLEPHWPEPPAGALRIFRCADPEVTESKVTELAGRFGLRRGRHAVTLSSADQVSYRDGAQEVTVHRASGELRYRDVTRWQVDHGGMAEFGEEEAVDIARSVVDRYDLAPSAQYRPAKVTRLRVGLSDLSGKNADERVIDIGVIFRRVVDDLPADGPGGHVTVYLDAAGEMTGVDRAWRELAGVEREVAGLQSPPWLEERLARFYGPEAMGRLTVDALRLGYFEQGRHVRQELLQPAYVVLATLRSDDERLRHRTVHVAPAATNGVGELMPLEREVRRQEPRADGDRDAT